MPLLRRARAAALCTAALAAGCLAVATPAIADPAPGNQGSCLQSGPDLRYLVIFNPGTSQAVAEDTITADCGSTAIYYPQIAVAVATSPDPTFADRIGPNRAYSAQSQAYYDATADGTPEVSKKSDEIRANLPSVTANPTSVSSTDRTGQQWDMDMIKADAARQVYKGSGQVIVGVLDSGIDAQQPNLAQALDPAASAGCVSGVPDTSETAWEPTTSAHGTHVAGTIAAADDGKGTAGVAPGVKVASVKVVDDNGYIYPEAAVCGFMWAAQNGMSIANNSYFIDPWVFTCADTVGQNVVYTAVQRAVSYATAHGVLSIAAAGNQGVDLTNPGQDTRSPDNVDSGDQQQRQLGDDCAQLPAGLPGVVTVSSVGAEELKAGYSSYGLGAIDLTAPGGDSHQHAAGSSSCVLSTVPDGYASACGTSMAAPHVSGVAALLASMHPRATPRQLTQLLNEQATPVACPSDYDLNGTGTQDAYCTGDSSYNSFYGHGLVNALAAVTDDLPSGQSTTNSADQSPVPPPASTQTQNSRSAGTPDQNSALQSQSTKQSTKDTPVNAPASTPTTQPAEASVPPVVSSLIPDGVW
ncbi:MAG TPA: S8 family serine peptidase [Pseudonocardiaceae bacterium]|nr:S8 family serine peptidase [Pseudonocardiaceae bacterium]